MRRMLLVILSLWIVFPSLASAKAKSDVSISVSVSPDSPFVSTLTFRDETNLVRELKRTHTIAATLHPHWIRALITVKRRTFLYDHDGRLFEKDRPQRYLLSKKLQQQIDSYVQAVEKVHFGQALPWEQVKKTFRRMDYATVVDLETGKQFQVQRRAGSRHADVQPLTRDDTMIMKSIYHGNWSWKRRAILVKSDGAYFAASMHGMPHGAGAIQLNEFPGHFCIHFFGSSTHRRKEPDPSHSLMILKASGALPQTLMGAEPEELVDYFLTSLNEHDGHTLRMTTDGFTLPSSLSSIKSVKKSEAIIPSDERGPFMAEIRVHVDFFSRDRRDRTGYWIFHLNRSAPWERWRITFVGIQE